jgi:sugar transferase EpsL
MAAPGCGKKTRPMASIRMGKSRAPAASPRAGNRRAKRLIDLVVASTALLVLSPVLGIVAALVRVRQGTPILFQQERSGLGGRPFRIYKFRTMLDSTDEAGHLLPEDQRLTVFGSFLRENSLDELPQLWNVIKGDMSVVGPRPFVARYLQRYNTRQARRLEVKPGITGWAQVNGRNDLTWEHKFELDVWYVDNQSFLLDLKILGLTLLKVLRREGISTADHPTDTEFTGTPPE